MENQGHRRASAIHELLRGREFTCQLKLLLTVDSKQSFIAEDLVGKILSTFTHTISLLNTTSTNVDSPDEVSQLSLDGPRKSESSSGDSSSKAASTTTMDRPGYSKKRKTNASESWVKESPNLVDDGHAWRKYGQKTILKSEFPRHYYRCTHKFDQKCQATKQVQMVQNRPGPLYRTTYSGLHTCNNNHFATQEHLLVDHPIDDSDSRHLISFNSKSSTTTTTTPFLASLSAAAVVNQQQQESVSDVASCGGGQTLNRAGDDYDMLSSYHVEDDDDDDDDDKYCNRSFLQMMIMDSVDDFGVLLG